MKPKSVHSYRRWKWFELLQETNIAEPLEPCKTLRLKIQWQAAPIHGINHILLDKDYKVDKICNTEQWAHKYQRQSHG